MKVQKTVKNKDLNSIYERRKIQKNSVSEREDQRKKFNEKPDETPGKTPKIRSSVGYIYI